MFIIMWIFTGEVVSKIGLHLYAHGTAAKFFSDFFCVADFCLVAFDLVSLYILNAEGGGSNYRVVRVLKVFKSCRALRVRGPRACTLSGKFEMRPKSVVGVSRSGPCSARIFAPLGTPAQVVGRLYKIRRAQMEAAKDEAAKGNVMAKLGTALPGGVLRAFETTARALPTVEKTTRVPENALP